MNNDRKEAVNFLTLLRSSIPEEREKAAALIFQEGMQAQKRIVQTDAIPAEPAA